MEEKILSILLFPYLIELLKKDVDIITRGIHEDCITHRLALYMAIGLENENNKIHVDSQYNRNQRNTKELNNHNRIPDIIVHTRNSNSNNIILIEAKKNEFNNSDVEKINYFLNEPYNYILTCGILYKPGDESMLLSVLSKEKHQNYFISKNTRVINKTHEYIRENSNDYIGELLL